MPDNPGLQMKDLESLLGAFWGPELLECQGRDSGHPIYYLRLIKGSPSPPPQTAMYQAKRLSSESLVLRARAWLRTPGEGSAAGEGM